MAAMSRIAGLGPRYLLIATVIVRAMALGVVAASPVFSAGSVTDAGDVLAMNFLMDRDAEHRARDWSSSKAKKVRARLPPRCSRSARWRAPSPGAARTAA
jgi:hypothetical protein